MRDFISSGDCKGLWWIEIDNIKYWPMKYPAEQSEKSHTVEVECIVNVKTILHCIENSCCMVPYMNRTQLGLRVLVQTWKQAKINRRSAEHQIGPISEIWLISCTLSFVPLLNTMCCWSCRPPSDLTKDIFSLMTGPTRSAFCFSCADYEEKSAELCGTD